MLGTDPLEIAYVAMSSILGLGLIVGVALIPETTLFTVWAGITGGWMVGWHGVALVLLWWDSR